MKKIYDILPIFCQNILISIYGYMLKKKRFNKLYNTELEKLKSQDIKNTNFKTLQLKKLNEFLLYAQKNSSYYNEKFKNIQQPLESIAELSKLPTLSKDEIKENIDDIITQPKKELTAATTGGTTGASLKVYFTNQDMQKRMAYLDYFKWKHGVELGMKRASFTEKIIVPINQNKNKYWRYNGAIKQLLFSSYHANGENLRYYIKKLNEFKPQSLDGYPSSMIKIAEYSKRNNLPITFCPKAIFPTAETLLDKDKVLLEEVFKTKVRNQYASSEGAPFITECVENSLHINIETGVFEKISKEDVSEIFVTSFTTHGTPLIRYKIGDRLEFTDKVCKCGSKTPIVKRILGRASEFLYDNYNNITINSPDLSIAVKQVTNIEQCQFHQKKEDEIKVFIKLSDKNKPDKTIREMKKKLEEYLSTSIKLDVKIVDNMKMDKSGKTRFIINELSKDELL